MLQRIIVTLLLTAGISYGGITITSGEKAGLDDKADKVLPYTHLTGANITITPAMSYVWETTAGTNLLTATGFTEGVDASCSMIITVSEGDTITASGLSFVDELEAGINHCFIRQMPTGEPKLFVSYVGVYGDIFVDGLATGANDGTSWANAYTNIQDAIDGATDGDLILVKPGTYQPIDTANKAITIESVEGSGTTIIDGGGRARCATLGESVGQHDTVLNGFTLQNGETGVEGTYLHMMGGGGALCGVLNNCTLKQNNTLNGHYGGGASHSVLNSCVLSNNTALEGGGSAYSTLNNCILKNNTAEMSGGGAYYGTLNNCTLVGNGSGGEASAAHSATLNNCIAWGGSSPDETNQGGSVFNYCNIDPPQPGTGNISQDPKFVSGSDLRLQADSPCINAGSDALAVGDKDLDGNPRKVGTVDMGAYEFQGD